jgi:hypothetical protein
MNEPVEEDDGYVKVCFQQGELVETLWAKPLGNHRYGLDNSPFYAYSVSWQDIIEAAANTQDGALEFVKVLKKSGYRTVRLILHNAAMESVEGTALLAPLLKMGCSYEGLYSKLISVSIPPFAVFEEVVDYVKSLSGQEVDWEYADPRYHELFPAE